MANHFCLLFGFAYTYISSIVSVVSTESIFTTIPSIESPSSTIKNYECSSSIQVFTDILFNGKPTRLIKLMTSEEALDSSLRSIFQLTETIPINSSNSFFENSNNANEMNDPIEAQLNSSNEHQTMEIEDTELGKHQRNEKTINQRQLRSSVIELFIDQSDVTSTYSLRVPFPFLSRDSPDIPNSFKCNELKFYDQSEFENTMNTHSSPNGCSEDECHPRLMILKRDLKCNIDSRSEQDSHSNSYDKSKQEIAQNEVIILNCEENFVVHLGFGLHFKSKRGLSPYRITVTCALNYFEAFGTCFPCDISCLECIMSSTLCTQCYDFYYLNSSTSTCNKCDNHCVTCQFSTFNCQTCLVGSVLYLATNQCLSCDPVCKECDTTSSNCISCRDRYALVGGTCVPCFENCYRCTSSTICIQCNYYGYFLSSTGTDCLPCDPLCYICSGTPSNCTACYQGYYSNSNTCSPCDTNCLTCSSNPIQCHFCHSGFYLHSNNKCKPCLPKCKTCNNQTSCSTCFSDYYLQPSTQLCEQCPLECASCSSAGACTSCSKGFYLLSGVCERCSSTCLTCSSATQCSSCFNGYILNLFGVCDPCQRGCLSCSSLTTCTSGVCATGSYYNSSSSACETCPQPYCSSCSSPYMCFACAIGFFLNGNLCLQCPPFCENCTNSMTCTQCQVGFFWDGSGTCQECDRYCKTCSIDPFFCTSCFDEFTLAGNSCNRPCTNCMDIGCSISLAPNSCYHCDIFCKTCFGIYSNECDTCQQGMYIASNECFRCTKQQCDQCDMFGVCSKCLSGFELDSSGECIPIICYSNEFFDGTSCQRCPPGCRTCYSDEICFSCDDTTLYLEMFPMMILQRLCVPCKGQCELCDEFTSYCTKCATTYYINQASFQCISNPYPCDLYDVVSSKCTGCADGFYLKTSNHECEACDANCAECTGPGNCTLCNTGYALVSGSLCAKCSYQCETCSPTDLLLCLTCPLGQVLSLLGECELCEVGYYMTNSGSCNLCSQICKTCESQYDSCTSCDPAKNRSLYGNMCLCDQGYFETFYYICQSCHATCATCFNRYANSCNSCHSNRTFDPFRSKCVCAKGEYNNDSTSNDCKSCAIPGCLDCESATKCLECGENMVLGLNGVSCRCASGYYLDATTTCVACSIPFCKDCSSGVGTCLACYSGQTNMSTCECNAIPFSIQFDAHAGSCALCHYSCATCNGFTEYDCLTCSSGRTQNSNLGGICACPDGDYDNPTSQSCEKCHFTCLTCKGPYANDCSSCDVTLLREGSGPSYPSQFECPCKNGYLMQSTTSNLCSPCEYSCETCSGIPSNCVTCLPGSHRTLYQGKCHCDAGYFDDGVSINCQKCHYSCVNCMKSGPDGCVACNSQSYRADNKYEYTVSQPNFRCDCGKYYYDDGSNQMCTACHYTCDSCNGPLSTDCVTCSTVSAFHRRFVPVSLGAINGSCECHTGFIENPPKTPCIYCPNKCATCLKDYQCSTCPVTRQFDATGDCVCKSKHLELGFQECELCSTLCAECVDSPKKCTSCDSLLYRVLNRTTMRCECVQGYFDRSTYDSNLDSKVEVPICEKCTNMCSTCTSDSLGSCTSCYEDLNYTLTINGECKCKFGFVQNGTVCEKIDYIVSNSQLDLSNLSEYSDKIQELLYVLRYASWGLLLFNQPFSSCIGFRMHQLLLMIWQTNSRPNAITISNLNIIKGYDPYVVFVGPKVFPADSAMQAPQYPTFRFEYFLENCAFLANGQELLFWLVIISLAYGLLRATFLRNNVVAPKEIYLQQNWRYRLLNLEIKVISPWCLSIVQILIYRLEYYALLELVSYRTGVTAGVIEAIFVILFLVPVNYIVLRGIFVDNSFRMKQFFQQEMKSSQENFLLVMFLSDQLCIASHVLFCDSSTKIQLAMIVVTGSMQFLMLIFFRPFKYLWEDILEAAQCGLLVFSSFMFIALDQATYAVYMSEEKQEEFNVLARLNVIGIVLTLLAAIANIAVRILKSLVLMFVGMYRMIKSKSFWLWEVHEQPSTKLEIEMHDQKNEAEKQRLMSLSDDIDKYIVKELLTQEDSKLREFAEQALNRSHVSDLTNYTISASFFKSKSPLHPKFEMTP